MFAVSGHSTREGVLQLDLLLVLVRAHETQVVTNVYGGTFAAFRPEAF